MKNIGFMTAEEINSIGFAKVGREVLIDRTVLFYGASRISLGSNVRIDAFSVLSAGEGGIKIGSHVHLGVYVFLTGSAPIELQDFSGLSGKVSIYSSNDDYQGNALTGPTVPNEFRMVTSARVIIGRHVVVGAGSIILPGVTISEGACVGALSLVRKDVPAFKIVAGSKGQIVGERKRDFLALETLFLNGNATNHNQS
jgi:galactoside O-acetyltransferase